MVFTNVPDVDCAQRISEALVSGQLAACVQILSPCQSVYHWQGKLGCATEIPVIIKTRQNVYNKVEAMILSMHPYELPEIIAFHASGDLPKYLQWVSTEISD